VLFDAVIALGVCSTLMVVIAATVHSEEKASRQLADVRAAMRLAEESLQRMQLGQPPASLESTDQLIVEPIEPGREIHGFRWVRVSATHNGRTVHLIGLARLDAGDK
jgi:hypothetical protein